MPSVVNGIGTWYWGKRNIRARRAVCRFCGHASDLRSYDTTLFFVVLFAPIIPLARKRIIDECPKCRKHLAAPLRKWEQGKSEALTQALRICETSPNDPASAADSVAATVAYQDEESFNAVATILGAPDSPLARDAGFQHVLAEAHAFFGHHDEAASAFRASLALKPDREVGQRLGVHLLRHGSVDEAWPLVAHALDSKDNSGIVYLAVEAYQAAGRHKDALALLERLTAAYPELARDKWHKRYTSLSRRHGGMSAGGTGKPIKHALIGGAGGTGTGGGGQAVRDRPWRARAARLIGPAVILLILAIYLVNAVNLGRARKVWLVNGLNRPYVADIGSHRFTLPPLHAIPVRIPEGDFAVKMAGPGLPTDAAQATISTPFWSRPFLDRTYIINPDRVALIGEETLLYSPTAAGLPPNSGTSVLHVGQTLYALRGIDYEFTTPPQKISVSKSSGTTRKKLATQWLYGPVEAIGLIQLQTSPAIAAERARRWVELEPADSLGYLALLATNKAEDAIAVIRPITTRRPVVLEAHRMYQELAERVHPQLDLEAEYKSMLAAAEADPGGGGPGGGGPARGGDAAALRYLLGRVTADRASARALWTSLAERAGTRLAPKPANADPDAPPTPEDSACAYALGALAYDANVAGRFDEALPLITRAVSLDPGNDTILATERETLHALGRFDDILAKPRYHQDIHAIAPDAILEMIYFRFRAKGAQDAAALVDELSSAMAQEQDGGRDYAASFKKYALLILEYCKGNETAYGGQHAPSGAPTGHDDPDNAPALDVAISAGSLDKAAAAAADRPTFEGMSAHLLVYLAASAKGDAALADKELALAIETLSKAGREERLAAAWLSGTGPAPTHQGILELPLAIDNKRVIISAVGLQHPDLRDSCFTLARKLNYDLRFPHLLIERVAGK